MHSINIYVCTIAEIIVESALPALRVIAMTKRRRVNLLISIYGNSFPIALTYEETRAVI